MGEERNAKVIFLAMVSRLLDKPVSIGMKGHSASGKSFTVTQTLKMFPEDSYVPFTAMSQKTLIYSKESYTNKTIVIYELTGMRENVDDDMTSYIIRTLLSEGRIDYEYTVRDAETGEFATRKVTRRRTRLRLASKRPRRATSVFIDELLDLEVRSMGRAKVSWPEGHC